MSKRQWKIRHFYNLLKKLSSGLLEQIKFMSFGALQNHRMVLAHYVDCLVTIIERTRTQRNHNKFIFRYRKIFFFFVPPSFFTEPNTAAMQKLKKI